MSVWLCICMRMILGVRFHGWCTITIDERVPPTRVIRMREVFRVEVTGKKDKVNATCAYDAAK